MAELSPLRRRMIEDMTIRNMSPATQRSYISAVSKFSRYFGRSPERLELEDVRAFQVHLVSTGISWASLNQIVCALRFFYGVTLGEAEVPERIAYAREPRKLPVVLSADEVVLFLESVSTLKSRAAFGLCRGAEGVGGRGTESGRHRQRAGRDPGSARQGCERPQRDAVAAVARHPARLLETGATEYLSLSRSDEDHSVDPTVLHAACRSAVKARLAGYRVDAIVSALAVLSTEAAAALAKFEYPVVSFNTPVKNEWVTSVSSDNRAPGPRSRISLSLVAPAPSPTSPARTAVRPAKIV